MHGPAQLPSQIGIPSFDLYRDRCCVPSHDQNDLVNPQHKAPPPDDPLAGTSVPERDL